MTDRLFCAIVSALRRFVDGLAVVLTERNSRSKKWSDTRSSIFRDVGRTCGSVSSRNVKRCVVFLFLCVICFGSVVQSCHTTPDEDVPYEAAWVFASLLVFHANIYPFR
jgi:hypothetical protein